MTPRRHAGPLIRAAIAVVALALVVIAPAFITPVFITPTAFAVPDADRARPAPSLLPPSAALPAEHVSAAQALAEHRAWQADQTTTTSPGSRPNADEPWDTIDACVESEMADKGVPGAGIAVLVDGELAYARGYGLKHQDQDAEVDEGTVFRIGSSTKMMTAAALMQQVEAGRVDLQAPVTDVITDFMVSGAWEAPSAGADDITGHHLLTHASAYPDNLFVYFGGLAGPTTDDALGQWAADQDEVILHAPPGSFWNYSNPNYSLAGRMLELSAGRPYHQVMADDLWQPAGLTTTFLLPAQVLAHGNYSYGHDYFDPATGDPLPPAAPDTYDNWAAAPAGFAFSTPSDMVRWAKLLIDGGGEVLSQASVDTMHQDHVPTLIVPEQRYGYGIFVEDVFGLTIYNHGGNIPGWSSQLFWVPERDFAFSVLGNTMSSLSRSAGCTLRTLLQLEGTPADHSTDPETWHRYTGAYRGLNTLGSEMSLMVSHTGDGLLATFPDAIAPGADFTSTLQQLALDTFLVDTDGNRQADGTVTFIDDEEGDDAPTWLRHRSFVLTRQGDLPGQETPTAQPPPATSTPPSSPTPPPPTATATATAGPTPRPTVDVLPESCPGLEARVPAAALAATLANPTGVLGYGELCYPEQPASPFNRLRRTLGMQNPNRPYHPLFNPVIFTCGCR